MNPRIIGLASPAAQCGKSTTAGMLVKEYGYKNDRFSAPLKTMWAALCLEQLVPQKILAASLEGSLKEADIPQVGTSFRTFAELVGTECFRKMINMDIWVNMARTRFAQKLGAGMNLVIEDVRFPNEADLIRGLGGKMLCITRPGFTASRPSEGHLANYHFDARFDNNASAAELLEEVREYMAGFLQVA